MMSTPQKAGGDGGAASASAPSTGAPGKGKRKPTVPPSTTGDKRAKLKAAARVTASIGKVIAMPTKRPAFRDQDVMSAGLSLSKKVLDGDNMVAIIPNVLPANELATYLVTAVGVARVQGRSGFGPKPRFEVCYTVDGVPYKYSGIKHQTTAYPAHIKSIIPSLMAKVNAAIPGNKFKQVDISTDLAYTAELTGGGSISAHADDEAPWGLILILSAGQTRWLRVRSTTGTKAWTNVELAHNSLVVLHGPTFQSRYTHQVDKLSASQAAGTRLSLNVRLLEGPDNCAAL